MAYLRLKKGHDIGIAGVPQQAYLDTESPKTVALLPEEFLYVKPKLLVKKGDTVSCGDPVFFDKQNPQVKWASPGGGTVSNIQYGPRRVIQELEITLSEDEAFASVEPIKVESADRDVIHAKILEMNLWPMIRQRPFNSVADPANVPKSIFISASSTAPLSVNHAFVLEGQDSPFQTGISALAKLTDGDVHVAIHENADCSAFKDLQDCRTHRINGPHPVGNAGVLIHHLDPVNPGDTVWVLDPQHVVILGKALTSGSYDPTIIMSVGGPSMKETGYIKTRMGVNGEDLILDRLMEGNHRIIRGDVLTGKAITYSSHMGYYHSSVSCIDESHDRPFLGWMGTGSAKRTYSLMRSYLGGNSRTFNFTTLRHGGHRAMVPVNAWEDVLPMDILPNPLYRAILAQDIDEMEKLGIMEVVEEDVALCSFACPSKIDLGGAIRQGQNFFVKEK